MLRKEKCTKALARTTQMWKNPDTEEMCSWALLYLNVSIVYCVNTPMHSLTKWPKVTSVRFQTVWRLDGALRLNNREEDKLAAAIKSAVKDPDLAEKLRPDYVVGCKRIAPSNVYLPTFNRFLFVILWREPLSTIIQKFHNLSVSLCLSLCLFLHMQRQCNTRDRRDRAIHGGRDSDARRHHPPRRHHNLRDRYMYNRWPQKTFIGSSFGICAPLVLLNLFWRTIMFFSHGGQFWIYCKESCLELGNYELETTDCLPVWLPCRHHFHPHVFQNSRNWFCRTHGSCSHSLTVSSPTGRMVQWGKVSFHLPPPKFLSWSHGSLLSVALQDFIHQKASTHSLQSALIARRHCKKNGVTHQMLIWVREHILDNWKKWLELMKLLQNEKAGCPSCKKCQAKKKKQSHQLSSRCHLRRLSQPLLSYGSWHRIGTQ